MFWPQELIPIAVDARLRIESISLNINSEQSVYKKTNKTKPIQCLCGPDVLDLILFLLILSHQGQGQTNKELQTNAISERETTQTVIKGNGIGRSVAKVNMSATSS